MKKKSSMLTMVLSSLIILLLASCQKNRDFMSSDNIKQSLATESTTLLNKKEAVTRAFRDSFDINLHFSPDTAGGWTPADVDAPAWFYGDGKGNATHMGNVNNYFNTHTLRIAGTVTVFQAPVNQFYGAQLQQFNVPSNVSAVDYDDKGNSIWFIIATEGLPSFHFGKTNIGMEGTMLIVGGTGKFVGATGETMFHAQFDQASWDNNSKIFTSCSMWQKGWIRY